MDLFAAAQTIKVVQGGEAWWVTAVVASGSAVLGAFVGGLATYQANERLERGRRKARALIRRKAKIYTPLRSELLALEQGIDAGKHFTPQIATTRKEAERNHMAAEFWLWREMNEDGRAGSATETVSEHMQSVNRAVSSFNGQIAGAQTAFASLGRRLYKQITGQDLTLVSWPEYHIQEIYLDGDQNMWDLFGFGTEERARNAENFLRLREEFKADPSAREARQQLATAEQNLRWSITAAVGSLEQAMQRIARRYEHEEPED